MKLEMNISGNRSKYQSPVTPRPASAGGVQLRLAPPFYNPHNTKPAMQGHRTGPSNAILPKANPQFQHETRPAPAVYNPYSAKAATPSGARSANTILPKGQLQIHHETRPAPPVYNPYSPKAATPGGARSANTILPKGQLQIHHETRPAPPVYNPYSPKAATLGGARLTNAILPKRRTQLQNHLGSAIQRLALAMGPDQQKAIATLAETGLWIGTEEYGVFAGFNDLTTNKDSNITLWGHAGQYSFGDFTPEQLVQKLIEKGLKDSGHTVLEIVGCAPNQTETKSDMTYVQRVQELLEESIKERKIQVKSFPMPEPGGDSTNYRFDEIGRFVYIYGDKDQFDAIGKKYILLIKVHGQDVNKSKKQNQQAVYDKFLEYLGSLKKITFLTDKHGNVRKYLEQPHQVKTHKGSEKTKLNELLLQDVYNK